jgi:hypothetical protein
VVNDLAPLQDGIDRLEFSTSNWLGFQAEGTFAISAAVVLYTFTVISVALLLWTRSQSVHKKYDRERQ